MQLSFSLPSFPGRESLVGSRLPPSLAGDGVRFRASKLDRISAK
jgi:hypothetical protein